MELWFLLFQSFQVDGEPWYTVSERVSSLVLEEGRCNKSFSLFLARTMMSWKQDRVSSEQFFCCWWAPKLVLRGCNMRVPFFSTWLPSRGGLAIEFLVGGSCCFVRKKQRWSVLCCKGKRDEKTRGEPGSQTREVIESCFESQCAPLRTSWWNWGASHGSPPS